MTMKDIAKGWEPRKPQDDFASWSKIIAASLTQGGGAGILGDFLFGEANRFGGGAAATAMGPGLGAAFDLFDIWRRAKEGDFQGGQLVPLAVGQPAVRQPVLPAPGHQLYLLSVIALTVALLPAQIAGRRGSRAACGKVLR